VPIDAVVAGVDLAADEPLPERRIAGVQCSVPVLIPGQQIGVFFEALREVFQPEDESIALPANERRFRLR
jgi:hypothetical protein